ncbi:hypothetical protein DEO72_LG10g1739 [Vigna unguiculata]|uniref:Uncharacterized protein n=1 Tax=Vigna unguiculata TaxID=3917 RepID=A0A4D6ND99_VIGUN|nr:hypothetical protein DEO72_LG10g1739 [Vigna unguiculata]
MAAAAATLATVPSPPTSASRLTMTAHTSPRRATTIFLHSRPSQNLALTTNRAATAVQPLHAKQLLHATISTQSPPPDRAVHHLFCSTAPSPSFRERSATTTASHSIPSLLLHLFRPSRRAALPCNHHFRASATCASSSSSRLHRLHSHRCNNEHHHAGK